MELLVDKEMLVVEEKWPEEKPDIRLPYNHKAVVVSPQGTLFVRVLQRYRTIWIYKSRFIVRNWLTLLWRLGSPAICCQQLGDTQKSGCTFQY